MKWKRLTELCRPKQWKTIAGKDLLDHGFPVYGANGIIGYWSEYNHVSDTITIACRGTCGSVCIAPAKSYVNGNAMCLDHLSDEINIRYLYYYLKWFDFKKIITGTTIPQITIEGLQKVLVPCPPMKEQLECVKTLECVEQLITCYEKELLNLDELVKAQFVEMFGEPNNSKSYPLVKVQDVADIQVGVVIKPAQYYTDAEHGVKAFRSLNVGEITIKDSDWVYFNEEGQKKNSKTILKENDLVIVRSGAPGTACVVTKQFEGSNAVDVIIAHPDIEKVNPYYLCAFTNYPHGKRQIEAGTGGAAQQHFNVGNYKRMNLFFPPKEEQDGFVSFVKQIDKSKLAVQQALEKAQLLFDSLMQKSFG